MWLGLSECPSVHPVSALRPASPALPSSQGDGAHRSPWPPVSRGQAVGLGYLLPGRRSQASLPWTNGDRTSSAGGPLQDPACFSVPLAASSSPLVEVETAPSPPALGSAWSPAGPFHTPSRHG